MTKPILLSEEEASKIERIFLKMQVLIGRADVGRSEVLQIIGASSQKEIGALIVKLNDLEKAVEEKAAHDTSEIASIVQASRQFSPQGMPSGMADFYDNEASAGHIWARKTLSEIDQIVGILAEISGVLVDSCTNQAATETSPAYFWPD